MYMLGGRLIINHLECDCLCSPRLANKLSKAARPLDVTQLDLALFVKSSRLFLALNSAAAVNMDEQRILNFSLTTKCNCDFVLEACGWNCLPLTAPMMGIRVRTSTSAHAACIVQLPCVTQQTLQTALKFSVIKQKF